MKLERARPVAASANPVRAVLSRDEGGVADCVTSTPTATPAHGLAHEAGSGVDTEAA